MVSFDKSAHAGSYSVKETSGVWCSDGKARGRTVVISAEAQVLYGASINGVP